MLDRAMASSSPTVLAPDELAERVAKLARTIVGCDVEVWWFGSWVRGTATDGSDVDIALRGSGPIAPAHVERLRQAIEALPTLRSVDLVDLSIVSAERRAAILYGARAL